MMPPKEERRFGGFLPGKKWNGCFMVLTNDKRFDAVQVNFSKENAKKFHNAIYNLFRKK